MPARTVEPRLARQTLHVEGFAGQQEQAGTGFVDEDAAQVGQGASFHGLKLAEKFGRPVFTFVDTPGAFPGIDAEERGQSEAIGHNLYAMAELKVPLIATIIGEGGSGGALAIAVGDAVLMLQYATYSVISPEGCASILWKTAERASDAAEALGLTAHRLKALNLIDKIVNEPLGGAHRDPKQMAVLLKRALADTLRQFQGVKTKDLLSARHDKLMSYGKFKEINASE